MEQLTLLAPTYEIRPSNRAKYAQIRITPAGKVLVVVPRRFDMRQIPGFVAEHQQWIDRKLQQMQETLNPVYDGDAPQQIRLRSVNEIWWVNYSNADKLDNCIQSTDNLEPLLRSIPINNQRPIRPQLLRWLNERAKTILSAQVDVLSQKTGLQPAALTIRGQKTRWGSCSSRKTLSLNRCLLFLPPAMVRYLIVHELCHLIHLNHSQRFWRLVEHFEPEYKQLDRGLAAAARYIPRWALPE